jgi:hypothetical protein
LAALGGASAASHTRAVAGNPDLFPHNPETEPSGAGGLKG